MSMNNERINRIMASELRTGAKVVTADEEEIGTVSEIQENFFKVDAPLQRDYWLGLEHASSVEEGRVCVSFRKQDVGGFKLSGPGLADKDAAGGLVYSDEEQRQQRETMLRDVAEKHDELAARAPDAERGRVGPPPEAELRSMESGGKDALDRELDQRDVAPAMAAAESDGRRTPPSNSERLMRGPAGAGPAEETPVQGVDTIQKELQDRQSQP